MIAWATTNGHAVIAAFEDAGISGATVAARPAIQDAVALACRNRGSALVVTALSRLAREHQLAGRPRVRGEGRDEAVRRGAPDARAGGMGEVGIASTPDVNAPYWNLAKTPFNSSKFSLGLTYTPWLKKLGLNDVYLASLSLG